MSATDRRVSRFVEKKAGVLQSQDKTHSRLRAVVHACGWKKRSEKNLQQIQEAFEDAGIYPEPMITAPGLSWDEIIYFTTEKALQRFLIQNFERIPAFKNLKQPETEYKLPSGRKIDILCRERKSNDDVVIELKKKATDPVGQLENYLVEVQKRLAQKDSPRLGVKGIIVTGEPNAALERELPNRIQDFPVSWLVFRAQTQLFERIRVP